MQRMIATLLLTAGLAAAGTAQPVRPAQDIPSETIVVQGTRIDDREVQNFVEALTATPRSGQISRFDWEVCPGAVGLGGTRNGAITQRLRDVAIAAGMRVGAVGCRPNMLLFVTRGTGRLIDQLSRKYPAYFDGIERAEIRRMVADPAPATAWHVEGLLDADGVEVTRDKTTGQYIVDRSAAPSRIGTATRPHFLAAIVAVELDALGGLTLTQVADYAAMRAFTRSDPKRLDQSAAPTVLSVIGAPMNSAVPITLTQWDLALLKSLYASNPNRAASSQRNDIKQRVVQELRDGTRRNR